MNVQVYNKIIFLAKSSLGTTFVVDDKFEFIKQIGHGAYGVVCSAQNKKTGQKVAIKKVYNILLNVMKMPFS